MTDETPPRTVRRGRISPPPAQPRQSDGLDSRRAGLSLLLHYHSADDGAEMTSETTRRKNSRTGIIAGLAAAAMVGLGFAAVPLSNLFCKVTVFNGQTGRASCRERGCQY